MSPDVDERRRSRARSAVEDTHHRRLDARDAVRRRGDPGGGLQRLHARADGHRERRERLVGAANGDAHALVLDLDLPHARLLDDLHELANALAALGVGVLGDEHRITRVTPANDLEQLLGVGSEHRDENELLLAGRETFRLLTDVLRRHGILHELSGRRQERDGTLDRRVDRLRSLAVPALDELAELVDDGAVAPRLEDVQERL